MEKWLNGWVREGLTVWMGQPYCAGCGASLGVASVAITGDEVYPEKSPDFPFTEGDCPLCDLRYKEQRFLSPDELAKYYDVGSLRKALAIKKSNI
jgi:hypothetical protein